MFPHPAAAPLGPSIYGKTKTLMPVFNTSGCVGHILRTARGFRACDANDKEIGVFETPAAGIAALLEAATDAA
jgi:hypothetical protein